MAENNSSDEGSDLPGENVKIDELSDDEFEDAKGTITSFSKQLNLESGSLDENLQEVVIASTLFWHNEFKESRKLLKEKYKSSMYHALGTAVFQFLEAFMTFESADITEALTQVKHAININKRFKRKENFSQSIGKMVGLANDSTLTELEIHAELVYAELHLLHAGLTFIQDENLVSFIKGALHIRRTYQAYSTCKKIIEKKKFEESSTINHFIGGVDLGSGAFNLLLSLLPARIVSLLEWVGFSCSKEKGFIELQRGYDNNNVHNYLCAIVLLGYYCFAAVHFGTHDADLSFVDKMLSDSLRKHPEGVYFLLFDGRRQALNGNFEKGKQLLLRAHETQEEWRQFSHICYWELMWYNAFQLNWEDSLKYAELLREESNWSKATYTYLCAIFILMQDNIDEKAQEKVDSYMSEVGQLRQRLAGKSIPMEKFIARKARKYFEQGKRLVLPGMEMMFVWFGLVMLEKNEDLLNKHLDIVKCQLTKLEALKQEREAESSNADKKVKPKKKGSNNEFYYYDDYCLLQLLRGTLLNLSGQTMQAELAFNDVVLKF